MKPFRSARLAGEYLLRIWNIPAEPDFFHGDGWAVLANLANWSAKTIDEEWYDWKPLFVQRALDEALSAWIDGDDWETIVYVETAVGQLSFHVFIEDGVRDSFMRSPRGWSGEDNQPWAVACCWEFIGVPQCAS